MELYFGHMFMSIKFIKLVEQQGFSDMHAWKKFQTQNFNISTSINTLAKLVDLGILKLCPS